MTIIARWPKGKEEPEWLKNNMPAKPVMSPGDKMWKDFVAILNFFINVDMQKDDFDPDSLFGLSRSKRILEVMGYDVEKSLIRLQNLGGYDDPEVLMNAENCFENEGGPRGRIE